ncbi:hypothetical protein JL720_3647 [Aureococcus anophagefferens]|nr:hypothetical protein JL720_3647 [Aureococcus anophagefferens]
MNKQLREQIDNLRKERVVFDGIYKKLEKDLHEKKKEMAAIIEDSKVAYQRSDRAMGEMVALKQQVDKEKAEFEREWRDLGKLMEQDRQLREQLRRQSREEHLAGGARRPRTTAPRGPRVGGDKDKAPLALSHDKVVSYEETFAKIREATGVETIKDLVDTFQDIEQKNFSLFNSINELNSDIEASELAIAETKLEIEKYRARACPRTRSGRRSSGTSRSASRTEAKADEYDLKHQNATKTINQLKTGIHSIFSRLGCASTSVEEMLGNQGVTESNMMQYLEIIEQRTTEILQMYAASQQSTKDDLLANSALQSGIVQPAASRLSVQPPAWDDFSSGDESDQEDDERPLTRDELQRKTLRGLGMKDKNQHHARATKVVKAGASRRRGGV